MCRNDLPAVRKFYPGLGLTPAPIAAFAEEFGVRGSEAVAINGDRHLFIGLGLLGIQLTTSILFLMWIYRANSNARQLGAQGMKFSPGWSVGFYFIPILWFWKPYQAMKEIWQASKAPSC